MLSETLNENHFPKGEYSQAQLELAPSSLVVQNNSGLSLMCCMPSNSPGLDHVIALSWPKTQSKICKANSVVYSLSSQLRGL